VRRRAVAREPMLFDIGWPELLLIGVVALVVIGPKDLPAALRVAGFWVRKARILSREFQSSVGQMIRDAELDEVRQDLKKATEFDLEKEFQQTIDPTGSLAESIRPPEIPDFFDSAPIGGAAEPARIEAAMPAALPDAAVERAPETAEDEAGAPELPGLELPPVRRPEPSNL
jgi:sec-independent protein translocase protein TatB